MGMELPAELRNLFSVLTGSEWPTADEDRLWELAQVYGSTADRLEVDLPQMVIRIKNKVRENFDATAADFFDESVDQFTGGERNYLGEGTAVARELQEYVHNAGTQVQYAKWMIIGQLVQLAAEIAWAVAMAPFTFGASLAKIPIFQAIARTVIGRVMYRLLSTLLQQMMISQFFALTMDALIQRIQIDNGVRDGWDRGLTGDAAKGAMLDGLFGTAAVFGGNALSTQFNKLLGNTVGPSVAHRLDDHFPSGQGPGAGAGLPEGIGSVMGRNNDELLRPFGMDERPGWSRPVDGERFRTDMGDRFADSLGASMGRDQAREFGELYADAFARNWGRSGLDDALNNVVSANGRDLGPGMRDFLTNGVPTGVRDGLSDVGTHWRSFLAQLGGQGIANAGQGMLSEGFYNLLFSDQQSFSVTWLSGVSGFVSGALQQSLTTGGLLLIDHLKQAGLPGGVPELPDPPMGPQPGAGDHGGGQVPPVASDGAAAGGPGTDRSPSGQGEDADTQASAPGPAPGAPGPAAGSPERVATESTGTGGSPPAPTESPAGAGNDRGRGSDTAPPPEDPGPYRPAAPPTGDSAPVERSVEGPAAPPSGDSTPAEDPSAQPDTDRSDAPGTDRVPDTETPVPGEDGHAPERPEQEGQGPGAQAPDVPIRELSEELGGRPQELEPLVEALDADDEGTIFLGDEGAEGTVADGGGARAGGADRPVGGEDEGLQGPAGPAPGEDSSGPTSTAGDGSPVPGLGAGGDGSSVPGPRAAGGGEDAFVSPNAGGMAQDTGSGESPHRASGEPTGSPGPGPAHAGDVRDRPGAPDPSHVPPPQGQQSSGDGAPNGGGVLGGARDGGGSETHGRGSGDAEGRGGESGGAVVSDGRSRSDDTMQHTGQHPLGGTAPVPGAASHNPAQGQDPAGDSRRPSTPRPRTDPDAPAPVATGTRPPESWQDNREGVEPARVGSHPDRSGIETDGVEILDGSTKDRPVTSVAERGFDVRRIPLPDPERGGPDHVTELTVRIRFGAGDGVRPEDADTARRDFIDRVDEVLNQRYRLPGSGDQFHIRVEPVGDDGHPHSDVVFVRDNPDLPGRSDTAYWRLDDGTDNWVHEALHRIGLDDEYLDPSRDEGGRPPAVLRSSPDSTAVHEVGGYMDAPNGRQGRPPQVLNHYLEQIEAQAHGASRYDPPTRLADLPDPVHRDLAGLLDPDGTRDSADTIALFGAAYDSRVRGRDDGRVRADLPPRLRERLEHTVAEWTGDGRWQRALDTAREAGMGTPLSRMPDPAAPVTTQGDGGHRAAGPFSKVRTGGNKGTDKESHPLRDRPGHSKNRGERSERGEGSSRGARRGTQPDRETPSVGESGRQPAASKRSEGRSEGKQVDDETAQLLTEFTLSGLTPEEGGYPGVRRNDVDPRAVRRGLLDFMEGQGVEPVGDGFGEQVARLTDWNRVPEQSIDIPVRARPAAQEATRAEGDPPEYGRMQVSVKRVWFDETSAPGARHRPTHAAESRANTEGTSTQQSRKSINIAAPLTIIGEIAGHVSLLSPRIKVSYAQRQRGTDYRTSAERRHKRKIDVDGDNPARFTGHLRFDATLVLGPERSVDPDGSERPAHPSQDPGDRADPRVQREDTGIRRTEGYEGWLEGMYDVVLPGHVRTTGSDRERAPESFRTDDDGVPVRAPRFSHAMKVLPSPGWDRIREQFQIDTSKLHENLGRMDLGEVLRIPYTDSKGRRQYAEISGGPVSYRRIGPDMSDSSFSESDKTASKAQATASRTDKMDGRVGLGARIGAEGLMVVRSGPDVGGGGKYVEKSTRKTEYGSERVRGPGAKGDSAYYRVERSYRVTTTEDRPVGGAGGSEGRARPESTLSLTTLDQVLGSEAARLKALDGEAADHGGSGGPGNQGDATGPGPSAGRRHLGDSVPVQAEWSDGRLRDSEHRAPLTAVADKIHRQVFAAHPELVNDPGAARDPERKFFKQVWHGPDLRVDNTMAIYQQVERAVAQADSLLSNGIPIVLRTAGMGNALTRAGSDDRDGAAFLTVRLTGSLEGGRVDGSRSGGSLSSGLHAWTSQGSGTQVTKSGGADLAVGPQLRFDEGASGMPLAVFDAGIGASYEKESVTPSSNGRKSGVDAAFTAKGDMDSRVYDLRLSASIGTGDPVDVTPTTTTGDQRRILMRVDEPRTTPLPGELGPDQRGGGRTRTTAAEEALNRARHERVGARARLDEDTRLAAEYTRRETALSAAREEATGKKEASRKAEERAGRAAGRAEVAKAEAEAAGKEAEARAGASRKALAEASEARTAAEQAAEQHRQAVAEAAAKEADEGVKKAEVAKAKAGAAEAAGRAEVAKAEAEVAKAKAEVAKAKAEAAGKEAEARAGASRKALAEASEARTAAEQAAEQHRQAVAEAAEAEASLNESETARGRLDEDREELNRARETELQAHSRAAEANGRLRDQQFAGRRDAGLRERTGPDLDALPHAPGNIDARRLGDAIEDAFSKAPGYESSSRSGEAVAGYRRIFSSPQTLGAHASDLHKGGLPIQSQFEDGTVWRADISLNLRADRTSMLVSDALPEGGIQLTYKTESERVSGAGGGSAYNTNIGVKGEFTPNPSDIRYNRLGGKVGAVPFAYKKDANKGDSLTYTEEDAVTLPGATVKVTTDEKLTIESEIRKHYNFVASLPFGSTDSSTKVLDPRSQDGGPVTSEARYRMLDLAQNGFLSGPSDLDTALADARSAPRGIEFVPGNAGTAYALNGIDGDTGEKIASAVHDGGFELTEQSKKDIRVALSPTNTRGTNRRLQNGGLVLPVRTLKSGHERGTSTGGWIRLQLVGGDTPASGSVEAGFSSARTDSVSPEKNDSSGSERKYGLTAEAFGGVNPVPATGSDSDGAPRFPDNRFWSSPLTAGNGWESATSKSESTSDTNTENTTRTVTAPGINVARPVEVRFTLSLDDRARTVLTGDVDAGTRQEVVQTGSFRFPAGDRAASTPAGPSRDPLASGGDRRRAEFRTDPDAFARTWRGDRSALPETMMVEDLAHGPISRAMLTAQARAFGWTPGAAERSDPGAAVGRLRKEEPGARAPVLGAAADGQVLREQFGKASTGELGATLVGHDGQGPFAVPGLETRLYTRPDPSRATIIGVGERATERDHQHLHRKDRSNAQAGSHALTTGTDTSGMVGDDGNSAEEFRGSGIIGGGPSTAGAKNTAVGGDKQSSSSMRTDTGSMPEKGRGYLVRVPVQALLIAEAGSKGRTAAAEEVGSSVDLWLSREQLTGLGAGVSDKTFERWDAVAERQTEAARTEKALDTSLGRELGLERNEDSRTHARAALDLLAFPGENPGAWSSGTARAVEALRDYFGPDGGNGMGRKGAPEQKERAEAARKALETLREGQNSPAGLSENTVGALEGLYRHRDGLYGALSEHRKALDRYFEDLKNTSAPATTTPVGPRAQAGSSTPDRPAPPDTSGRTGPENREGMDERFASALNPSR